MFSIVLFIAVILFIAITKMLGFALKSSEYFVLIIIALSAGNKELFCYFLLMLLACVLSRFYQKVEFAYSIFARLLASYFVVGFILMWMKGMNHQFTFFESIIVLVVTIISVFIHFSNKEEDQEKETNEFDRVLASLIMGVNFAFVLMLLFNYEAILLQILFIVAGSILYYMMDLKLGI